MNQHWKNYLAYLQHCSKCTGLIQAQKGNWIQLHRTCDLFKVRLFRQNEIVVLFQPCKCILFIPQYIGLVNIIFIKAIVYILLVLLVNLEVRFSIVYLVAYIISQKKKKLRSGSCFFLFRSLIYSIFMKQIYPIISLSFSLFFPFSLKES